jgi:hypothetical protein
MKYFGDKERLFQVTSDEEASTDSARAIVMSLYSIGQ